MSILDQKSASHWKEVVKEMDGEEFKRDPLGFLAHRQVEIDSTLSKQVDRLQDLEIDRERIEMWNALKALAEGHLKPEERREIICKLAESYRGFLGWEGNTDDEPGW
jgi:hypothetical protein